MPRQTKSPNEEARHITYRELYEQVCKLANSRSWAIVHYAEKNDVDHIVVGTGETKARYHDDFGFCGA